jgi:hypothetical protein
MTVSEKYGLSPKCPGVWGVLRGEYVVEEPSSDIIRSSSTFLISRRRRFSSESGDVISRRVVDGD